MATHLESADAFLTALAADGRSDEISESEDLYGWLIGSWDLDVLRYWAEDVSALGIKAEVHAGWVLEGRVLQDVWIMPPLGQRSGRPNKQLNMYGTTIRAWDESTRTWRINWSNPAGNHFVQQIGRRSGNDIVQLGTRADGTTTRWRFVSITADSFHWLGEALTPEGRTWTLEGEFLARRRTR